MNKFFSSLSSIQIINYTALALFILTALFSKGHHQSDEHYQVLESAQYKLGIINANELPWEFEEKMRPSLQPYMALVVIKAFHAVNIQNPFIITSFLRIMSAVLLWFIMVYFNKYLISKYFPEKKWALIYAAFSFFIWYVPYISVRFSSENYSGAFLLLTLYFILNKKRDLLNYFLIGIFLGLSFTFRYQMGIAIFGIFLWTVFHDRPNFIDYWPSFISFFFILILGTYLDSLFFNEFVLAPVNYFKLNLIQGRASDFGVDPFWYYMTQYVLMGIPPLSILFFVLFAKGSFALRKHIFIWAIMPFIFIHFFIAHKEIRFMFPISYLFTFIAVWSLREYLKTHLIKKYQLIIFKIVMVVNMVLLCIASLKPANEKVVYYKYLYHNKNLGKNTIISTKKDYYEIMTNLKTTMYTAPGIKSYHVENREDISEFLLTNSIDTCFYAHRGYTFEGSIDGYSKKLMFRILPDHLDKLPFYKKLKLHTDAIYILSRNNK